MPDILEAQKIAVKIDLVHEIALERFIPVFHDWIRQQAFHDHLLIDVADYKHVPQGPGVLLIGHHANISIDLTDGRMGLMYLRKQAIEQSFAKRIGAIVGYTLELADKLEAEPSLAGEVKFDHDAISIRVHDRLLAPNTPETFAAVQPILTDVLIGAIGHKVELEHRPDPSRLFEAHIRHA